MLNEFLNIYESGLRDANASLTIPEAIHRIVEKINLLIKHFNLLEDNVNGSIDDFSEKIEYYLNNGMMTMPAMALILLGCVIWVHRAYFYKEEKK